MRIPIARQRLGKQVRNKYATNNRGRTLLGKGRDMYAVVLPEAL
jgi:hypothetical protein